ncbi:hypothetical protein ACFVT5_09900 [Streptomyces sp. NPDC058001]|uniref:hypothetical protein n=1 Tax=Streptomyces sp. NPDC058001 TaxID=3346300 RepID=UPI0036E7188F
MSAMPLALLVTTAAATAVGAAALHAVHGLRRQITALRSELAERHVPMDARAVVPAARTTPDTEHIRAAVAEALAEEREREMAEARAFWAAQEARDASDAPSLLGLPLPSDELYLPRQADFVGLTPLTEPGTDLDEGDALTEFPEVAEAVEYTGVTGVAEAVESTALDGGYAGDSPELAAARRRHPSHPDFVPVPAQSPSHARERSPIGGDHERTVLCLEELAATRAALTDVRPGPLGTLDVYVFEDGTTLCMTPGHRETAERLAGALRAGDTPVLLGGSGVSGAYALTFSCGTESVYVLADRVIASI